MQRSLSVLLVCSGLDHAHRGFESFARECFDELVDEPALDLRLIKGSGLDGQRETSVRSMPRDTPLAQYLGQATGREPFRFEQVAFAFSLQLELRRRRPDIVYFSEWHTGLVLAKLRGLLRQTFRLVFCNGAMASEGFEHLARVQQLTPAALDTVLELGGDPARHAMLPLGFALRPELDLITAEERFGLRQRLALPLERTIVISVAALNKHHKRLDYLIRELGHVPGPRPFLLLLGQPERETPEIRALAQELLGPDGHDIRTVPHSDVRALTRASDHFVLPSLGEGLPRALVEAMAQGTPCLTHDYGVTRFVLGEQGDYADFSKAGGLARQLSMLRPRTPAADRARHAHVFEHLSWERLRPAYVQFLSDAMRSPN